MKKRTVTIMVTTACIVLSGCANNNLVEDTTTAAVVNDTESSEKETTEIITENETIAEDTEQLSETCMASRPEKKSMTGNITESENISVVETVTEAETEEETAGEVMDVTTEVTTTDEAEKITVESETESVTVTQMETVLTYVAPIAVETQPQTTVAFTQPVTQTFPVTEPQTTAYIETPETNKAPATTQPLETTSATPGTISYNSYEECKGCINTINEYRRKEGVGDVEWSDALYAAALIRAKMMYEAKTIEHYEDIGAEIHAITSSPGLAVEGWVYSPGHYSHMVAERFDYCAVAVYENYAVGMFSEDSEILFSDQKLDEIVPAVEGLFDGNTTLREIDMKYAPDEYAELLKAIG